MTSDPQARHPAREGSAYRRDIQYLRAVAVGMVVLFHFWPDRMPGGFVGVDIFFVISGFLITSHLLTTIDTDGRVRVLDFWGKRLRRLLPASLLVLAVSVVCVLIWIPSSLGPQALREIIASALYGQNWLLAADSVDYLASTNQPSLVQHFWSLSVEEQFYVAWPLLLAAAVWAATRIKRSGPPATRSIVVAVLGVIAAGSFATSVVMTITSPSVAYFATTTRAWEFALGGLVAAIPAVAAGPRRLGGAARWAVRGCGAAAILGAGFLLSGSAQFPGWIAIVPTAGTALVIWAGIGARTAARAWSDPVEIVGDRSYSIYLWHWPILIVAPYALGHALGAGDKILLLVLALVLAGASKSWVEDPVRRSGWLRARLLRTFALAGIATLVVVSAAGASLVATTSAVQAQAQAQAEQDAQDACAGSAALAAGSACPMPFSSAGINTLVAQQDRFTYCILDPADAKESCTGGATEFSHTLALVGDSHAASVAPLVFDSVPAGWRVVTYFATGCPGITRDQVSAPGQRPNAPGDCAAWSARILDEIESRDDIDAVLFTGFMARYSSPETQDELRLTSSQIESTFDELTEAGKQVIALRDVPGTTRGDIPVCLDEAAQTYDPCTTPRSSAVDPADVLKTAADAAGAPYLDLTDRYCDESLCHAVVGGMVVYSDDNHVTVSYARTLAPELAPELARILAN